MAQSIYFLLFAFSTVVLFSCKKYPENDGIVSNTAKKRLVGTWMFERQSATISSLPADEDNYIFWRFQRDGEASRELNFTDTVFRLTYFPSDTNYTNVDTSALDYYTWEFTDKKNNITLTNNESGEEYVWKILKLSNSSLIFERIGSKVRYEYSKNSND